MWSDLESRKYCATKLPAIYTVYIHTRILIGVKDYQPKPRNQRVIVVVWFVFLFVSSKFTYLNATTLCLQRG